MVMLALVIYVNYNALRLRVTSKHVLETFSLVSILFLLGYLLSLSFFCVLFFPPFIPSPQFRFRVLLILIPILILKTNTRISVGINCVNGNELLSVRKKALFVHVSPVFVSPHISQHVNIPHLITRPGKCLSKYLC